MKNLKYIFGLTLCSLIVIVGCKEDTFEFGDLSAPSNLVINTEIVGESAENPSGDGSGEVIISLSANNAITYHIGIKKIDDFTDVNYSVLSSGILNQKFTSPGINTYRISVIAYGPGGTATNASKDITVRSDFVPDAYIVTALTNDASKIWVVNKDLPSHFGVDDFTKSEYTETAWWWSAGPDEKVDDFNCFYTATFNFTKSSNGTYSLTVDSPDGILTKTGDLAGGLPGIPDTGDEDCYDYVGGTSSFDFIPSSSPISADTSTKTAIQLSGTETFIGYGATLKEYEILQITTDFMYLRVQGTETGNSWYLKLKPAQ